MSMFERMDKSDFWAQYRRQIEYADQQIVSPILKEYGVVVPEDDKWSCDANSYFFTVGNAELEVVFDCPADTDPLMIELRVYHHKNGYEKIGDYLPVKDFYSLSEIDVCRRVFRYRITQTIKHS